MMSQTPSFGRSLLSAACFVALMWILFFICRFTRGLLLAIGWDPFSTVWFPISFAVVVATLIQLLVLDRLTRYRTLITWLIIGLGICIAFAAITIINYESFGPHPL
jgi:hypothetical protein